MLQFSSEGIVLKRVNYGEGDRILVVFSKSHGKLSLLAKGVRKLKSRKRGHIEIFSQIKFSASKTRGMDVLTEASTINDFKKIRHDLKKVLVAYYFCEVINKISKENESLPVIYSLLFAALKKIEASNNLKKLRKEFIEKLLVEAGYWPRNQKMINHDLELSNILERQLVSVRVGRRILS